MLRVTAVWNGFVGSPGYSNFYFGGGLEAVIETGIEAKACAAKVSAFFASVATRMPPVVAITVQPTVARINPATGALTDEFTVDPAPATIQGSGTTKYSAPSGAVVNWRTGDFVDGKRLRGKTFLVPMSSDVFGDDGTLGVATLDLVRGAAQDLAGGGLGLAESLQVWHRPVNKLGGSVGKVNGVTVPDKAAILSSRRD